MNNHAGDFVVDLPKTYLLEGSWECALTELTLHPQTERRTERLYLCSDLVQEKYFPAGFTLRRPDAVRPRIRKTLLHEDASDGVESSANIYKRRSTSTLSIQNRSTVLHASFEKTKMGSIEIYDHKNKRLVPYVPDYKKWEQHFTDVSEGRALADHRGRYLVGRGARWRPHTHKVEPDTPKVELVTQILEMAKSELARQKVIRGKKPRGSFNQLGEP